MSEKSPEANRPDWNVWGPLLITAVIVVVLVAVMLWFDLRSSAWAPDDAASSVSNAPG